LFFTNISYNWDWGKVDGSQFVLVNVLYG
jgi:hypothetical protein